MTQNQEQRISAMINAQGFDPSREIEDLPYFVGEKEFNERHGSVIANAETANEIRTELQ
jgi:hypothetical protein